MLDETILDVTFADTRRGGLQTQWRLALELQGPKTRWQSKETVYLWLKINGSCDKMVSVSLSSALIIFLFVCEKKTIYINHHYNCVLIREGSFNQYKRVDTFIWWFIVCLCHVLWVGICRIGLHVIRSIFTPMLEVGSLIHVHLKSVVLTWISDWIVAS